ncbi:hypothetical protein [Aeromicrobium sp. CTD01-1L150]|uniref:hypothetical protein n=1 Tax=Aeromicrobium sp. CTD01-1L150 TaxID=3341830 RepID=UPI0035C1288E
MTLQFSGFASGANLTGEIYYFNPDSGEREQIGDFSATLGADGTGEGTLTITGASPDDQFQLAVSGGESNVNHYITATAGSGGSGGDDADEASTSQAPRAPERVDTGR